MTTPASSSKKKTTVKKVGRKQATKTRKFERITVSLPPDTATKVAKLAARHRRNVSNMVYTLILEGMERIENQPAVL